MTHPILIYLDQNIATIAAVLARQAGASAHIKVETVQDGSGERPLFVVETEKCDRQRVIDSIADAADTNPNLRDSAIHCPHCSSIQIEYPDHPEVSPTMLGLSRLMDSLGRFIGLKEQNHFHCLKCGEVWVGDVSEAEAELKRVAQASPDDLRILRDEFTRGEQPPCGIV